MAVYRNNEKFVIRPNKDCCKDIKYVAFDDTDSNWDRVGGTKPPDYISIDGTNNSGAVFNLMTRDGKEDRLLTALDRLEKRMIGIRTAKLLLDQDPTPTLAELEQSHVIFIKQSYKPYIPVASEYQKITPVGGLSVNFDNTLTFEIPNFGDFMSDQVLHLVISGFGIPGADAGTTNSYRYAPFPGLKWCEYIEFSVGNVKIDGYTNMDMLFQSNFMLEGHKKLALARAVGQQEDKFASYYMPSNQINIDIKYTDGAQTPKTFQPRLELWIPLVFYHNLLPSNALSHRALPWGQRFIKVKLGAIERLITARAPGGTTKIPIPADVKDQIKLELAELYTNNLFIGADIHDIYMKKINFTMIRVHGHVKTTVTNPNGNFRLNGLKWATEFMYVGFRPLANNTPERWTDLTFLEDQSFVTPVYNGPLIVPQTVCYKNKLLPVKTLAVKSNGVVLYDSTNIQFYEDYLPFARSNTAVGLRGAFLIPFNLKTGELQPTGYINMSRNDETYLEWTGGLFNNMTPAELFVSAIEINFLIIKDNKAWLLYN